MGTTLGASANNHGEFNEPTVPKDLIIAIVPKHLRLFMQIKGLTNCTPGHIQQFQEVQLQKIIAYCSQRVPFYRGLWNGFIGDSRAIEIVAKIEQLPALTKCHVHDNLDALVGTSSRPNNYLTHARPHSTD